MLTLGYSQTSQSLQNYRSQVHIYKFWHYMGNIVVMNWLGISLSALCRTLLYGLVHRGLWLKWSVLDVAASSGVVTVIWLSERPHLKMPHTDGGETSSRNYFDHRPRPSSPDNRVLQCSGNLTFCMC